MKKQRYRYLAAAVALATGVAVLPGAAYAAEEQAPAPQEENLATEPAAADSTAVAEKTAGENQPADSIAVAENAAGEAKAGEGQIDGQPVQVNERTSNWT